MKKDIFNGNIKREYIGFMWFSIILFTAIFVGVGTLIFVTAFYHEPGSFNRNGLLIFGIFFNLIGVCFFFGSLFVIRKYPKYQKYIKWFFNSDCYFVGNNSKNYYGTWKGKPAFDRITKAAEQNKGLEDVKYPNKYRVYIALVVMCIVLMFIYLGVAYAAIENLYLLPKAIQNEGLILAALIIVEVFDIVLSFVFAFRVRKIREKTVMEYRIKQRDAKSSN